MRPDLKLFKEILERYDKGESTDDDAFPGRSEQEIAWHKWELVEAGFAEGPRTEVSAPAPAKEPQRVVIIQRITWKGYQFLENAENGKRMKEMASVFAKEVLTNTVSGALVLAMQAVTGIA